MSDQVSSARDPEPGRFSLAGKPRRVRLGAERQAVIEVDSGMPQEGVAHAHALGRLEGAGLATAECKNFRAGDMGGEREQRSAVVHYPSERGADPIPFEHRKFRRVQRGPLAVAENVSESKDLRFSGGQQLLHREFRRGMEPGLARRPTRADHVGAKPVQVGFVAGRGLKGGGVDLDEALGAEPLARDGGGPGARLKPRMPGGVAVGAPERRGRGRTRRDSEGYGEWRAIPSGLCRRNQYKARRHSRDAARKRASVRASGARQFLKDKVVRVIASSIRKGNIIEREDGQLCVVLSAESFHPGKGTPTTQIDMRRLSDGVKVTDRFKTTEQVERAFVEDKNFDFLYSDGDGYHFMNAETYDQIAVAADIIGDQAQWLQEGMKVILSIFNELPVGIQLPPRVTLEVVETEPAMKGQTASSSYKPAKLSNGARAMVPPHISPGTRIVIQTEDGSYVERAKD